MSCRRAAWTLRAMGGACLAGALVAGLCGCSNVARQPAVVVHVEAKDLSQQHPLCLQNKNTKPPQAVLVKSQDGWARFWGQGEDPPVVNFDKEMLLVASASVSSEGPGTLEVWVLKYVPGEAVMEGRVKEVSGGEWPLSAGFSRAYEIVRLPRTDNPVKVMWRRVWGNVDETKELQAVEWVPSGQAAEAWGNQSQQGQGGWGQQGQGWGNQGQRQ